MTRYLSRPSRKRMWLDDGWSNERTTIDVIVRDDKPERTGLLDLDGNDLYRVPPNRPVGFTVKWADDD